jgi:tRNA G18 (ribose-2'-O)-methylase SpoU
LALRPVPTVTAPKSCKGRHGGRNGQYHVGTFASLKAALEYVRTEWPQYQILGVETTAKSVDYREFAFAEAHAAAGVALVLGNEVTGVDATILPTLDGIVEIPMFGAKNSLNVAVCAPIILYEIQRQWKSSSSSISSIATTKELTQEEP